MGLRRGAPGESRETEVRLIRPTNTANVISDDLTAAERANVTGGNVKTPLQP